MVFSTLLPNILPLYILIAMGFYGARRLGINLESMAAVAIYFISPVVVFGGIVQIEFQAPYLILPFILFMISAVMGMLTYVFAKKAFQSPLANLIGMTSTNGNSGYFGLPIVLALYGPSMTGIYLMMTTFIELSTNTVGYYILARGHLSVKDSVVKVLKLPPLHGLILGLIWNFAGWPLPDVFFTYWDRFAGAWVIIGMTIIGVAIGKQDHLKLNFKLLGWMLSIRYILWPVMTMGFVLLDRHIFGLFDGNIHTLLLILGVIPHAANAVAFAAQLKVCPEDTATVVLISTAIALVYLPLSFIVLGAPF